MRDARAFLLRWLDHPRAPVAIVVFGLGLRVAALVLLAREPLAGDALSYHQIASKMVAGVAYEPDWPPGVPALLYPAYLIFGAHEVVGRALMLFVHLIFCVAVLKLGRRLAGRRAANLALGFFAVSPIFVWSSVNPLTQLPTAALALFAVIFVDHCRKGEAPARNALALGLCLAGLLLTRPSNVAMVAALPIYLLWKRSRWQTVVIPCAVVLLLGGGWCWRAYQMTGRPVFINNANSQNVFYGNNPATPLYRTWWYGSHKEEGDMTPEFQALRAHILHADMKDRDALYMKVAMDHIRARPDLFLLRSVNRVRVFLGFDTFTSAQVAKTSKPLGVLVLAVDAGLYLLLTILALLFPAVVLSRAMGWAELIRAGGDDPWSRPGGATGPASVTAAAAAAWGDDRKQSLYMLLLISFLYAFPYFFAFSHPTFHVPVTAMLAMIGAMTGVAFLDAGFVPVWRAVPHRARLWTVVALVAYLAIQVEWAAAVLARVGAG